MNGNDTTSSGARTPQRQGRPGRVIPLRRALMRRLQEATGGDPSNQQMHELRLLAELAKGRLEAGRQYQADAAAVIVTGIYEGRCWCESQVEDIPPGHLHRCRWADENHEEGGF